MVQQRYTEDERTASQIAVLLGISRCGREGIRMSAAPSTELRNGRSGKPRRIDAGAGGARQPESNLNPLRPTLRGNESAPDTGRGHGGRKSVSPTGLGDGR